MAIDKFIPDFLKRNPERKLEKERGKVGAIGTKFVEGEGLNEEEWKRIDEALESPDIKLKDRGIETLLSAFDGKGKIYSDVVRANSKLYFLGKEGGVKLTDDLRTKAVDKLTEASDPDKELFDDQNPHNKGESLLKVKKEPEKKDEFVEQ